MNRLLKTLLLAGAVSLTGHALAAPPCAASAISQAEKLLRFHADGDDRIYIAPQARALAPLTNPADRRQKFQVLEVWGHIYKASYRMRLIYFPTGGECVLMGQEILETAQP